MAESREVSTEEIQELLILFLKKHGVRWDFCVPILLIMGDDQVAMLKLMQYMKENNPTEEEIIDKLVELK